MTLTDLPTKVDFHMHTNVSDGTDSPEEILCRVCDAGIRMFSVTDHDAVKAAGIIRARMVPGDPVFVPGVEFSCEDAQGKYHILGYGFDPESEAMESLIRRGHTIRMEKVGMRLGMLRDRFGFAFSDEDVRSILELDNPGKPHIARMMIRYGYASDIKQAIKTYIDRLEIPETHLRPEEAVSGIISGGGIPVLAHPVFGDGDDLILGEDLAGRVGRLREMGVAGLEGFYSGYTEKIRSEVLTLAESYGMMVTAGSDYHGGNKLVRLGDTGLEGAGVYPVGLRAFIERVWR